MIQNYNPSHIEEYETYEVVFDDGHNNGYGFPCDVHGNILPDLNECAKENYAYCMSHLDEYVRANEVITRHRRVREPATGTCHCGNEVVFYAGYYGACQCDQCGQWYNLFGQELLPPDEWEEDY